MNKSAKLFQKNKNGLDSLSTNLLMALTTGEAGSFVGGSVNAVSGDASFSVIFAFEKKN